MQFPKDGGDHTISPPVTPFLDLSATTKSLLRIASPDVASQPFPGLTGIDSCLAQTLRNEIIIAAKNLFQNPKHQGIPQFLQPIDDLVKGDLDPPSKKKEHLVELDKTSM